MSSFRPAKHFFLFELHINEALVTSYPGGVPKRSRWQVFLGFNHSCRVPLVSARERESGVQAELPLSTIVNYNLPTVGAGFMFFLLTLYLLKFSTDVLLMSPAAMGLIYGISRNLGCNHRPSGRLFE